MAFQTRGTQTGHSVYRNPKQLIVDFCFKETPFPSAVWRMDQKRRLGARHQEGFAVAQVSYDGGTSAVLAGVERG